MASSLLAAALLADFVALAFSCAALLGATGRIGGYLAVAGILGSMLAVAVLWRRGIRMPRSRTARIMAALDAEDPSCWDDPAMDPLNKALVRKIKTAVDREYKALISKKQAEINALQSQINPHFLYNTLDSIRGQALVSGADEIARMTEALAVFFRYSISRKGIIVTVEDELKNVDTYLTIQRFRFDNRFSIEKDIEDPDTIMGCRIPKLTIQPIIENAIYHGLETKEGPGRIIVRMAATASRLLIHIIDDGVGINGDAVDELNATLSKKLQLRDLDPPAHGVGIALRNVNDRIKLCFGEDYGIFVSSTEGAGTDVGIRLPLKKEGGREPQFVYDDP